MLCNGTHNGTVAVTHANMTWFAYVSLKPRHIVTTVSDPSFWVWVLPQVLLLKIMLLKKILLLKMLLLKMLLKMLLRTLPQLAWPASRRAS